MPHWTSLFQPAQAGPGTRLQSLLYFPPSGPLYCYHHRPRRGHFLSQVVVTTSDLSLANTSDGAKPHPLPWDSVAWPSSCLTLCPVQYPQDHPHLPGRGSYQSSGLLVPCTHGRGVSS